MKDADTWSKEFKERFAEIVTDQELIAITRDISRKSLAVQYKFCVFPYIYCSTETVLCGKSLDKTFATSVSELIVHVEFCCRF